MNIYSVEYDIAIFIIAALSKKDALECGDKFFLSDLPRNFEDIKILDGASYPAGEPKILVGRIHEKFMGCSKS